MNKLFFILFVLMMASCGQSPTSLAAFDPNIYAVQQEMTAEAAQDQARLYGVMATGSAEAPLMAITQTAAAFQINQAYAQATSTAAVQTQMALLTVTAQSWTPTPNATMTAVFAQSYAEATKVQLEVERAQDANIWNARKEMMFLVSLLCIAVSLAYVLIKRLAFIPHTVDERGKAIPVIQVVEGVAFDIERSANGMIGTSKMFLKQLPRITGDRQDPVTARAQLVDMATRARLPARLLQRQAENYGLLPDPDPGGQSLGPGMEAATLPLPPWDFIRDWTGDARPLGFGLKGLITAKAASPHLLISGKTGTGKTVFMLRTQVTASLARGVQVINLGFSDSGFGIFQNHPNYHAVHLEQASDLIDCLSSVYRELKERKQIIGGDSVEWDHWPPERGAPPRPFVDLVIDELGNVAEEIYQTEESGPKGLARARELWRWISMIANEGRKVGIRFVAALQDPTAKSVDLRFRRNCTLVSFQQGDASQSSAFLGTTGAERLQVGHFMARTDGLVMGGGFAPTDEEIVAYLEQHATAPAAAPTWIHVSRVPPVSLPAQTPPMALNDRGAVLDQVASRKLTEKEAQVIDLYIDGLSKSEIARRVYGYTSGAAFNKVADLIRWYEGLNTTTTSQMPAPEPIPA